MQGTSPPPLYPQKRHQMRHDIKCDIMECPLWAKSGQRLPADRKVTQASFVPAQLIVGERSKDRLNVPASPSSRQSDAECSAMRSDWRYRQRSAMSRALCTCERSLTCFVSKPGG